VWLECKTLKQKTVKEFASDPACSGRILFMDDDELIRKLVPRMLNINGYEVDVVSDGKSAVSKYRKEYRAGKKFDVVIMDLTIPGGMGGKDAALKIKEIDPGAKVVASSGYSCDPVMADFGKFGFCAKIIKPYTHDEMQVVLRNLLEGENGVLPSEKRQRRKYQRLGDKQPMRSL
jgi:two-component system, cell cycle sensor histidine kinase and response regulator CckA